MKKEGTAELVMQYKVEKVKVKAMTMNMDRDVYNGWTPKSFIIELQPQLDMIMSGHSWKAPFKTKKEMVEWIKDNQPYYKKAIPEVNSYFAKRYNLR